MKVIHLPVSEKKNFEVGVLCSCVLTCEHGAGLVLNERASYEQMWYRSTIRCYEYMSNIKALDLPVSEKKNFEVCLLCSHVQTCDYRGGASFDPRDIV